MLITLVLWALDFGVVIFGILHLIGVSIMLAYPFLRLRLANLAAGLLLVALGVYLRAEQAGATGALGILLAPLGVEPEGLYMPDYRPLLPWFGVVLIGLFFGNAVYGRRDAGASNTDGPSFAAALAFLGMYTLVIYLIHQPILIALLWMIGAI